MCVEFDDLLRNAVAALLPFAFFIVVVMILTNTIIDTKSSQENPRRIALVKLGEPSRWKGLWIVFSGGLCGAVVTYLKPTEAGHYQWLYESIAQTSYMFASALAAMYVIHGYKHADPSRSQSTQEKENDAE